MNALLHMLLVEQSKPKVKPNLALFDHTSVAKQQKQSLFLQNFFWESGESQRLLSTRNNAMQCNVHNMAVCGMSMVGAFSACLHKPQMY